MGHVPMGVRLVGSLLLRSVRLVGEESRRWDISSCVLNGLSEMIETKVKGAAHGCHWLLVRNAVLSAVLLPFDA